MANKNRDAGHNYERTVAARWRDLGYPDCQTTRYASKMLDDKGVDLAFTDPFLLQCKRYTNTPALFKLIEGLEREFAGQGKYPVVYWKKPRQGELAILRAEDFEELVLKLQHGGMI